MFGYIQYLYEEYILKNEDPRTKDFFLMGSPIPLLLLIGGYLAFVKVIGPRMMKNREPFKMNKLIIAYNAYQCIFSVLLVIYGFYLCYLTNFNPICEPQHYKTDPVYLKMVRVSHIFLLGRFTEFTDTIFFILRKKFNQASTLHVVHHALVPVISWIGVKLVPGGHYNFAGYVNVVVHSIMYFYYMLAAMGPNYKKYLWWKKYMTVIQLVQFVIVICHTINTIITDCPVPKLFGCLVLFQAVLFFILFFQFYINAFNTKPGTGSKFKFSINMEKYYEKYRHFFEMCVPNQHALLDDNYDDQKTKAVHFSKENGEEKIHTE